MVYDPVTTFFIYIVGIFAVLIVCAVLAEIWGAKVERDARHRARAEARANRREERVV